MLIDAENLVSVQKLSKHFPKYLAKLKNGSAAITILQGSEIVGFLVRPEEYAGLCGDYEYHLLKERMKESDTIPAEEVRARAHRAIRRAARKRRPE